MSLFQVWVKEGSAWLRVGEPRPREDADRLLERLGHRTFPVTVRPASSVGDHCRRVGRRRS